MILWFFNQENGGQANEQMRICRAVKRADIILKKTVGQCFALKYRICVIQFVTCSSRLFQSIFFCRALSQRRHIKESPCLWLCNGPDPKPDHAFCMARNLVQYKYSIRQNLLGLNLTQKLADNSTCKRNGDVINRKKIRLKEN